MEKRQESKEDMQAMMEVYRKMGTPGVPHQLLANMAGHWDTKIKSWIGPDTPPTESRGNSEQKMILGGRYLQQEFAGDMMGNSFTGIGIMGYDNHTKKYVSTWIDTMSTGIFFFEGTAGRDGKIITQKSRYNDPVRGPMTYRAVTRVVNDNTMVFEMYGTEKGEKEAKMMEITYTRRR